MKKLISSLMIGFIATTATMSTMAAPAFGHNNPPAAHFDKKPMPPKHFNQHERFNKHDRFAKKHHKGFFNKNNKHDKGFEHNRPAMPPKHR